MSEHKGVRSWTRRLWVWFRRGVGWKTPQPDVETVEPPPEPVVEELVLVAEEPPKKRLTLEEQACAEARANAQKYGHKIGDFVEKPRLSNDRVFTAICKKCGLNIDAVVEYNYKVGLVRVGGKAKNKRCEGESKN